MIHYKTDDEIELLRKSCLLVCSTLSEVAANIKPGVTPKKLDTIAEAFIRDNDAVPGFLNYRGFPATLCISRNDVVVHGIPDDVSIKEGDILSIDCGVVMNGFNGDAAFTFAVGEPELEIQELMRQTREALRLGIAQAVPGNRIGDIGYAIQHHTEKVHGYGVVRELVGHGLGKSLHEEPEVPNYGKKGKGRKIRKGLVIAIEPMINLGTRQIKQDNDGWTIRTRDNKASAHFEHSIAVRENGADILSDHNIIEAAVKNNSELLLI